MPIRSLAVLTLSWLLQGQASAQIHAPFNTDRYFISLAEEQYLQQHYRMAQQSVSSFYETELTGTGIKFQNDIDKANYIKCISLLKTNHGSAVEKTKSVISGTANPVYKQRAAYALANYFFRHGKMRDAIPFYEMCGIDNLSNREIADAKFELAYCYFNQKQFDKAETLFATMKEVEGKYYNAGNYYYALLAYNKGNFSNALASFKRIENHPEYQNIVPYYIAEIYYFTGDKKKALDEALRLMKRSEKLYYDNELHLLAAQCYFEEQKYQEALGYFEHYYENSPKIRKEELYEMAFCYYKINNYSEAIDKFKPLSNSDDSLGQSAMYLLGDCYLKTNDKKNARNAYSICADMDYNVAQKEASLFLAGKLAYEMGYTDEALSRMKTLLRAYPNTASINEAKTIYSALLLRSNNYTEAYTILNEVKEKDANYWPVYQKVMYGYALEQMRQGDYNSADQLLDKSIENSRDDAYQAAAWFWRGELAYRQNQFAKAEDYTLNFLSTNSNASQTEYISSMATEPHAYMTLGYSAMKLENFAKAKSYFAQAQSDATSSNRANAVLREADAAFMARQYNQAITLYDKALQLNVSDADYASYQKAILLGLQNNNSAKTALLQQIINQKNPSGYEAQARYELAIMNIESHKYVQAVQLLEPLTNTSENRSIASKAWLKIGYAQEQLDKNDKAIEAYTQIVQHYYNSEERPSALDAIRSLYIEDNKPGAYVQLLREHNLPAEDNHSLDSTYYAAAQAQFASGKYSAARQAYETYLNRFPNGVFSVKASYYKAEAHAMLNEESEALRYYGLTANSSYNDFTEISAQKAAAICYKNKDYAAALPYYEKARDVAVNPENLVTAYTGLMQSNYKLNNYTIAALQADTVLSLPDISESTRQEALYIKANALLKENNTEAALAIFTQLEGSKDNAIAAEAKYRVAEDFFKKQKYKEAEEKAVANFKSGNEYWTVKSYILVADIALQQKDFFNAKATIQSVIKRTKIEELRQEATAKLDEINRLEKSQSKLSEE